MSSKVTLELLDEGFDVLNPTSEDASLSAMPTNTNCNEC
jgi:hypothetical protein